MRAIAVAIEAIEAEAWAQLHEAIPPSYRAAIGSTARHYGPALSLVTPGVDEAALNRTIGLGFETPFDAACLASINAAYLAAGCKRSMVEWAPDGSPTDGVELITAAGATERSPTLKLYGDLRSSFTSRRQSDHTIEGTHASRRKLFRSTIAEALGTTDEMLRSSTERWATKGGITISHSARSALLLVR